MRVFLIRRLFAAACAACAVLLPACSSGAEGLFSFRAGLLARGPGIPLFRGPGGGGIFLLETSPRGARMNPAAVFRSEVRAVPFDGSVLLIFDHYRQPSSAEYRLYAGVSAGAGLDSMEFKLAAVLEPHDFDYVHAGLTNFVEYYYIVTVLDSKTGEYAVSDRIAFAVPGEGLGGYLDEMGEYLE